MSFYGNKNALGNSANSATPFYFDKIYPNRKTMDEQVNDDGVYLGRYVLVKYSDDDIWTNYYQTFRDNNEQIICKIETNLINAQKNQWTNPSYYQFELNLIVPQEAPIAKNNLAIYRNGVSYDGYTLANPTESSAIIRVTGTGTNSIRLIYPAGLEARANKWRENYGIDAFRYWGIGNDPQQVSNEPYPIENASAFDLTVWQKTIVNDELKYIMVSSLASYNIDLTATPLQTSAGVGLKFNNDNSEISTNLTAGDGINISPMELQQGATDTHQTIELKVTPDDENTPTVKNILTADNDGAAVKVTDGKGIITDFDNDTLQIGVKLKKDNNNNNISGINFDSSDNSLLLQDIGLGWKKLIPAFWEETQENGRQTFKLKGDYVLFGYNGFQDTNDNNSGLTFDVWIKENKDRNGKVYRYDLRIWKTGIFVNSQDLKNRKIFAPRCGYNWRIPDLNRPSCAMFGLSFLSTSPYYYKLNYGVATPYPFDQGTWLSDENLYLFKDTTQNPLLIGVTYYSGYPDNAQVVRSESGLGFISFKHPIVHNIGNPDAGEKIFYRSKGIKHFLIFDTDTNSGWISSEPKTGQTPYADDEIGEVGAVLNEQSPPYINGIRTSLANGGAAFICYLDTYQCSDKSNFDFDFSGTDYNAAKITAVKIPPAGITCSFYNLDYFNKGADLSVYNALEIQCGDNS